METLLLWQFYFLGMKTSKVWHLAVERSQIDKSVNLVCQQYRFLFVNTLFIGTNLYKEVFGRDMTSIVDIVTLVLMILRSRRTTTLCCSRHLNVY